MIEKRTIYTDGGCDVATKNGAWACLIANSETGFLREIVGRERDTTCNRMEMTAIIAALEIAIPGDMIMSDSQLCVNTLNEWAPRWERNGWRKSDKRPVMNLDLVKKAMELKRASPGVVIKWIKGHAGIAGNERVDQLCTKEIARLNEDGGR
jgi:ribonuclease HI